MSKLPPLPEWIRPAFRKRPYLERLAPRLRLLGVSTICESARCPNLGECFSAREASFLLMGERCTRNCRFCAVDAGPPLPPDPDEPARVARAVAELELRHVVLTSVTRDDLPDGGAQCFVAAIQAVRAARPETTVEVLVPDFMGDAAAVRTVVDAQPDVFAHNVETVPRLYPRARARADWERSLRVLQLAKTLAPQRPTKSGLMVGLGETKDEILQACRELRRVGVDFLTIGQYLQPTPEHLPVVEYVDLGTYDELAAAGRKMGFSHVAAAPLVRSSYRAGEALHGVAPTTSP